MHAVVQLRRQSCCVSLIRGFRSGRACPRAGLRPVGLPKSRAQPCFKLCTNRLFPSELRAFKCERVCRFAIAYYPAIELALKGPHARRCRALEGPHTRRCPGMSKPADCSKLRIPYFAVDLSQFCHSYPRLVYQCVGAAKERTSTKPLPATNPEPETLADNEAKPDPELPTGLGLGIRGFLKQGSV